MAHVDDMFGAVQRPRPLPVLVLADASGSMGEEGKIETLNASIAMMIRDFAAEDSATSDITIGVIAFGNDKAWVHQAIEPAGVIRWQPVSPRGSTPLGKAFRLARDVLEDESAVPRNAFQPTLVLVSDGWPNDQWEQPLEELLATRRGRAAMRLAVAVGSEVGSRSYRVLERFVGNPAVPVVRAAEVGRLREFFSRVSMSVTTRAQSGRPDDLSSFDVGDLHDLAD